MRLILLGGRIIALMGRVVGVRAAGDPGGDIVMAVIVGRSLFSVSICLFKIQNTSVGRSQMAGDQKTAMHNRRSIEAIFSKSTDKIRHVGEERRG
jgi:hypothetical protein